MNRNAIGIVLIIAIVLQVAVLPGCRRAVKQPINLSSLTSPVPYSREEARATRLAQETARAEEDATPRGKLKNAATATLVIAGVAVLFAGYLVLESWSDDDDGFDIDTLWHQGYGFNNPNPERKRKGLPLLNFDGTVAK